ncbi:hypothetical protein AV530_000771 [Patagioenas fasciata monilis]|uniref:Uncharacterized protein n=1 Tax=Patagioenas fasciata monilis TaxID=372326 RepID=A0A1V4KS60_PATFA|nr:hypothetical protein AV530_000771 [Patagioenas fasciata monilis]
MEMADLILKKRQLLDVSTVLGLEQTEKSMEEDRPSSDNLLLQMVNAEANVSRHGQHHKKSGSFYASSSPQPDATEILIQPHLQCDCRSLSHEQAGSVCKQKTLPRGGVGSCTGAEDKPRVRRADTSRASPPAPRLRLGRHHNVQKLKL